MTFFSHKNLLLAKQHELATGKSLAGSISAVEGYRVCYRTSATLLADLTASLADKTLPQRVRYYSRPQLLIIDKFGLDRIERSEGPQAAHLLYKIIAARNQKCSTALVTNVAFDKWGDYLFDGPLAMALLDRLVQGAIIFKIKGKSYRAYRQNSDIWGCRVPAR